MTPLELDRRDAAESLVTADRVVPAFDELEDRHARLGLRRKAPAREQLALQRREEALAHGVVIGITHRSHRRPHLGFLAAKPEGNRGVLRAVIGVMHNAFRPSLPERHVERAEHEIGGRLCITIAHGRRHPSLEACALQPLGLHETSYTLFTDTDACFAQIHVDVGRTVSALGARVVHANVCREPAVLQCARRRLALGPRVIAARGDCEHATHRSHRILGLVRRYEPEDFLGVVSASLANQAVAFARISRSSFTLRSSRRSCVNSSRSVLVSKSRRLPPLASARATQLRIVCAVGSNSFASASGLRPDWTSSTIFCRNSGGYATRLRGIVDLPYPYIEKCPRKRVNSRKAFAATSF